MNVLEVYKVRRPSVKVTVSLKIWKLCGLREPSFLSRQIQAGENPDENFSASKADQNTYIVIQTHQREARSFSLSLLLINLILKACLLTH